MGIVVDEIREEDLPRLAALYEQLSMKPVDPRAMKETFMRIRESDDYYLLCARDGGGMPIGTVMGVICHDLVGECRPFMVMENFIVDGEWHRKGVGSLLIRRIEEIGRVRNCLFVQFCSSSFRTGAHEFYRQSGYDPDEVRGFRKYF